MLSELKQYLKKSMNPEQFTQNNNPVIIYGRAGAHSGLEEINIFRLGSVIYIQIYKPLLSEEQEKLKAFFFETFPEQEFSIVNKSVIPPEMLFLSETITEDIIYEEKYSKSQSLKYYLDLKRPSHPGIFFDIQPARKWVFENSYGKKVLNLFAFTCPFSVCAAAGGAELVINMDNNSNVLTRGRNNHTLNDINLKNIKFEKKDVMKSFGYINKKGPFDIIICDPPSLQKGSFNAQKDYSKLVRRLKEALSPEGILMLCLNDPFLGFGFLEKIIQNEKLIITEKIEPDSPFISTDNNRGLKVICTKHESDKD